MSESICGWPKGLNPSTFNKWVIVAMSMRTPQLHLESEAFDPSPDAMELGTTTAIVMGDFDVPLANDTLNEPCVNLEIPNRLVAVYQLGRLANRVDWHWRHCLFFISNFDTLRANDTLARIQSILLHLFEDPPKDAESVISKLRRRWHDLLCCEASAEEVAACFELDAIDPFDSFPERAHSLVENWVQPLTLELVQYIQNQLSGTETWVFALGRCLDQGICRPGVELFFEAHDVLETDPGVAAQHNDESAWNSEGLKCRRIRPSFRPGDLPPEAAWKHMVQELLSKAQLSGTPTEILAAWSAENTQNQFGSTARTVDILDQCIRDRLANDATDGERKSDHGLGLQITVSEPTVSKTFPTSSVPMTKQDRNRLLKVKKAIDRRATYVGESRPILEVFGKIQIYNKNPEEPVLVLGPTGVGKTLIAKLIHQSSDRAHKPFRRFQAMDFIGRDELIARSQWQGIGKQSGLPDVKLGTKGIVELCNGGTIFIDEVAELPPWFQTLLLDVLDGQEIPPASGQGDTIAANVRLILATNADLKRRVSEGLFRDDLYQRIAARILRIPPLNERTDDIPAIVSSVRKTHPVTPAFLIALMQHDWRDGNVRQLLQLCKLAADKCKRMEEPLNVDQLEDISVNHALREQTDE